MQIVYDFFLLSNEQINNEWQVSGTLGLYLRDQMSPNIEGIYNSALQNCHI